MRAAGITVSFRCVGAMFVDAIELGSVYVRTDPRLEGIAHNQGRAAGIPLPSERWPRKLLAIGQTLV